MHKLIAVLLGLVAVNAVACDIGSKDYQECLMRQQQQDRIERNTAPPHNESYKRGGNAIGKLAKHRRERREQQQK